MKKNKLLNNKGISFLEMVTALMVMVIMLGCICTGVSLAVKTYNRSMASSEGQLLSSTIRKTINSELTYCTNIEIDETKTSNNVKSFQGTYYDPEDGNAGTLHLIENRICYGNKTLVPDATYTYGNVIDNFVFSYDENSKVFSVYYDIKYGDEIINSEQFTVKNIAD